MKRLLLSLTLLVPFIILALPVYPPILHKDNSTIKSVSDAMHIDAATLMDYGPNSCYSASTKTLYEIIPSQNGTLISHVSNCTPISKSRGNAPAGIPMSKFKVKMVYDPTEFTHMGSFLAVSPDKYESGSMYNKESGERMDEMEFELPIGVYDFHVKFFHKTSHKLYLVIVENVDLSQASQIVFSPEMATNEVSFCPLLPTGDKVRLETGKYERNPDTDEWEYVCIEKGNVDFVSLDMTLSYGDNLGSFGYSYSAEYCQENDSEELSFNMILSPVSANYGIPFMAQMIKEDENGIHIWYSSVVAEELNGKHFTTVENYNALPIDRPWKRSVASLEKDMDYPWKLYTMNSYHHGQNVFYMGLNVSKDANIAEILYSPSGKESLEGSCFGFAPVFYDQQVAEEMSWGETYYEEVKIIPVDMMLIDGEWKSLTNTNRRPPFSFEYGDTRNIDVPAHPRFSYVMDDTDCKIGNTVPVLEVLTQKSELFPDEDPAWIDIDYIGRNNEERQTDIYCLDFNITNNGEMIASGMGSEYYRGLSDWILEGNEPGAIEYEFYNSNMTVDDMEAYNHIKLKMDYTQDDICAPTLRRLMLRRNSDDFMTDRFENKNDGFLEFCAGDFNIQTYFRNYFDDWEMYNLYWEYEEPQVEVEYSPMGTDNWSSLRATKEEDSYVRGFGETWRCELSDVKEPSESQWYDVRITLTDAAGNYQQQTLSPCFMIAETTVIDEAIATDPANILVSVDNNGVVTINGEASEITIYDMSGRIVFTQSSPTTIVNTCLGSGAYIIKVKNFQGQESVTKALI